MLIHDSQYTDAELASRAAWGHSACGYAVGLGAAARAARVLLFHHEPSRSDEAVDEMVGCYRGGPVRVDAAAEDLVIDLPYGPALA